MALSRNKKSEGGMLDGIKAKLGFADPNQGYDEGYYSDEGYEDFGDANDFGEFGDYGADYRDDGFSAVDDSNAPVSHFEPYSSTSARSPRASRGRTTGAASPNLVSIDDVRAHTQVPESLGRDPLPQRRVTSSGSYRSSDVRTMVEASQPIPTHTPAARANRERSESLNSLFVPTVNDMAEPRVQAPASAASNPSSLPPLSTLAGSSTYATATTPSSATSYDPYEAYAGAGAARHTPVRSLTVLKPASYGEVERVAKALKAGDVVVLALRNTPDNLAKRILDFSFGVSSALDASVESVADKVFVITRGDAITDRERANLRSQGVL